MLKLYNTLSRKKEIFRPRQKKLVRMFVCGPTVYDFSHIGHARTYLCYDAFARYLKFLGFKVQYLQNITDIDDKIISRAQKMNISAKKLAEEMEVFYLQDMATLNINSVTRYAQATNYINEIVKQTKILIEKKHAYLIKNDGYYFDLKTFPDYGKLSGRTTLAAQDAVSRIDTSIKKKNKGDFCLWKFSKPGEPSWKTKLGKGRPGWHIEDTAIAHKIFGAQYDIHGGGLDLIFPHHEAEIAQMEGAYGKKPMAKYWMHSGMLKVSGEKMSKSLKNFITIRQMLETWDHKIFRVFVFSSHYRSPINYDDDLMAQAASSLRRLEIFLSKLQNRDLSKNKTARVVNLRIEIKKAREKFFAALNDDFNTPLAIGALFSFIKKTNPVLDNDELDKKTLKSALEFFKDVNEILDIIPKNKSASKVPNEVLKLLFLREKYRKEKNFLKADRLRKEILNKGFALEDTENGPRLKAI